MDRRDVSKRLVPEDNEFHYLDFDFGGRKVSAVFIPGQDYGSYSTSPVYMAAPKNTKNEHKMMVFA